MYAAERADIHAFLSSLTPAQWDEPSLCQGWRVRDVAVHLLVDEPLEQLGVVRAVAKAATMKFSVHRINEWWVARNRERPTPTIVTAFDGPWRPGRISKMLGPQTGIRAVVIHHQDMRRALAIPRVVPAERVRAALDMVLTPFGSTNLGSAERAAGLRLQADDIDWSWGDGPEVTGPAEALLLAVAGRPAASAPAGGGGPPGRTSRPVRRRTPGPSRTRALAQKSGQVILVQAHFVDAPVDVVRPCLCPDTQVGNVLRVEPILGECLVVIPRGAVQACPESFETEVVITGVPSS
jgi:uncharacterized protein (TIGR03083 family)